jgi:hypothetical protein
MEPLTWKELRERLAVECRARKWPPPSRQRLKKLRDSGQLPKALPLYEKGKRGRSSRFEASTVVAYIRAEELRRASGKRVQSWKRIEQRERHDVLRAWLANPDAPIPRDAVAEALEEFSGLIRGFAPTIYPYIERPVGPFEDDRLDGAHTAIESVLDAGNIHDDLRAPAEAILRILVFRDEAGNADDVDLAELLEPVRQRAGPFGRLSGVEGICSIVREIPFNELLTQPRKLLDAVTDDELRESTRTFAGLFRSLERVANVASVIMSVLEKAKANETLRSDVRLDWLKPVTDGASLIKKQAQSELGATLLCGSALVNIWRIRKDPDSLIGLRTAVQTIDTFATMVEHTSFAKKEKKLPPALNP